MVTWNYLLSWFYLVFVKKLKELNILKKHLVFLGPMEKKKTHSQALVLIVASLIWEILNSMSPLQLEKSEAVHSIYIVSFRLLQILTVRSMTRRALFYIIKTFCSVILICFNIMQPWPLQRKQTNKKKTKSNVSQCWFTFPCLLNCCFCFLLFECYACFHSWAITYLLSF